MMLDLKDENESLKLQLSQATLKLDASKLVYESLLEKMKEEVIIKLIQSQ